MKIELTALAVACACAAPGWAETLRDTGDILVDALKQYGELQAMFEACLIPPPEDRSAEIIDALAAYRAPGTIAWLTGGLAKEEKSLQLSYDLAKSTRKLNGCEISNLTRSGYEMLIRQSGDFMLDAMKR